MVGCSMTKNQLLVCEISILIANFDENTIIKDVRKENSPSNGEIEHLWFFEGTCHCQKTQN